MGFLARGGSARKLLLSSTAAIFILTFSSCSSAPDQNLAEGAGSSPGSVNSSTAPNQCSVVDDYLNQIRIDDRVSEEFIPIVSLSSFDAPADLYETTWMLALAGKGGEVLSESDQKVSSEFWSKTAAEVRRLSNDIKHENKSALAQLVHFGKTNQDESSEIDDELKSIANQFLKNNPTPVDISDPEGYLTQIRLAYAAEREDLYPNSETVEQLINGLNSEGGVNLFNLETLMLALSHDRTLIGQEQRNAIDSVMDETLSEGITLDELPVITAAADAGFLDGVQQDLTLGDIEGVEETAKGWYTISGNRLPDPQTTFQVREILGDAESSLNLTPLHSTSGGWVRGTQASLPDTAVWHRILSKCSSSPSIANTLISNLEKGYLENQLVNGVSPNAAAHILGARGETVDAKITKQMEIEYSSSIERGDYFSAARMFAAAQELNIPVNRWPSAGAVAENKDNISFNIIGSHYLKAVGKFPGEPSQIPGELLGENGITASGSSKYPDIYTTLTLGSLVYENPLHEPFIQGGKVCQIPVTEAGGTGGCGATMLALGSYILLDEDPRKWVWW